MSRAAYVIGGRPMEKGNVVASIRAFAELFRGQDGRIDYQAMQTVSSILSQKGDAELVTSPQFQGALGGVTFSES